MKKESIRKRVMKRKEEIVFVQLVIEHSKQVISLWMQTLIMQKKMRIHKALE